MNRIVHIVIGKANPQRANGVNKVAHALVCEQIRSGLNAEIWGLTPTPDTATSDRPYKLRLHRFFLLPFGMSQALQNNIAGLKKTDIVHFHGALMPSFHAIAKRLKAQGTPWVLTMHSHLMKQSMKKKKISKWFYLRFLEKFVLQHAKGVHAITQQEVDEMPRFVDKEKTICIPNAYSGTVSANLKKPDNKEAVFLYIGRMAKEQKGLDTLIDAFVAYKSDGYAGKLLLVGDGPDKGFLQQRSNDKDIEFLPPAFDADKQELLKSADFFICPSRWDVIPTAILEAAAHGLPLIVSRQTGFAAFIQQWACGYVSEADSMTSLLQAMIQAHAQWQKREMTDMQGNARKMIETDFSLTKVAARINAELYRNASHV